MSTGAVTPSEPNVAELFTPKLVSALREGYGLADLRHDAVAGLTVAIVALPLAMAIGIASGSTPDRGLLTAIVAGLLISVFGGSRFQIGGPTAAFIVVVYQTIERHGFDGLVLASFIAGMILLVFGLLRLGTYIKYMPFPVVIGFTSGIAVSIIASQIKDLLGLTVELPGEFVAKIPALADAIDTLNPQAVAIAALAIGLIATLRRVRPRWPGFLIAVVATSLAVLLLGLDVATIGSEFGGVPRELPLPAIPMFDLAKIHAVMPDALTIALLAGIESLLSAVVADGMTGRRHRSNCELVAQGIANIGSSLFGGLPATGAIARTATNIRAGARTPIAGILHAMFLLAFVLVAAPILGYVPLAALAAILVIVAWNIGEFDHIRQIMTSAPIGDRGVLLITFLLTVLVDLTVAIEVGVVLAAFLFMHRMAEVVEIEAETRIIERDTPDTDPRDHAAFDGSADAHRSIVYRINGPFFFGATQKFSSVIERLGETPKVYVLDFSGVPFIDSTATAALKSFVAKARSRGTQIFLAGVSPRIRLALRDSGVRTPDVHFVSSVEAALAAADKEAS